MRKLTLFLLVTAVAALVVVPLAFGQTPAPTFSADDLRDPIYAYATKLLSGLGVVLAIVLVPAAAFTLMKIGVSAIRRWIGRGKATATV